MNRYIPICIAALGLSGCASRPEARPEPIVITKEVVVPGPQSPCVPANLSSLPPAYPDTDAALRAAEDAAERYQLMAAGRKDRIARLNELEPIIASCPKAK